MILDSEFSDVLIHVKVDDNNKRGEKPKKKGIFPITRYKNILNAPHATNIINTISHSEFQLYKQESIELNDDDVFKIIGERW